MVMKWTVCLVALALLGSFCEAQWIPGVPTPNKQVPHNPQQTKQTFEKPLTWKYPEDPEPLPKDNVDFELRSPVAASSVSVGCREKVIYVEVQKDMFGTGQLINPADLTLGNCAAVREDTDAKILIYEAQLQDCLSALTRTEDYIIYTFTMNYLPRPLGSSPVVRTSQAAVIVECHYPRKHNVSSLALHPAWRPFSAVRMAQEFLYFTLRLMTDDFQHERPSHQYFLGDIINIEATVRQFFHVPLRVYVESCYATPQLPPDVRPISYSFINDGCLIDARLTGSHSRFMPRTVDNKLQFQLEAFKFQAVDNGILYITCHLKASSAAHAIDTEHRACCWNNGWYEAGGVFDVCGSCESGLGAVPPPPPPPSDPKGGAGRPGRKIRDVSESEVFEWEGDVALGPINIAEKMVV
uniref:Zona pellucida sperm-binding protein 3 n=1 Tax=Gasterosteus aculeatus aculeatus TaxID=481459 RepID=A0AAQ4QJX7_GASAC|nr:zona pellucida sperm-binding protein 3-like [Gasterosteus aculeatus aculeatus]